MTEKEEQDWIEYDYEDSVIGKCKLRCSLEMVQDMELYHRKIRLIKGKEFTEEELNYWSGLYDRWACKGFDAPILTDPITPEEVNEWWTAYTALKELDLEEVKKKYNVKFEEQDIPYITAWQDAPSHYGYDSEWRRSGGYRYDYREFVLSEKDLVSRSDVYYKMKPPCGVCGCKEANVYHVRWSSQTLYRDGWWYLPEEFWLCDRCTVQDAVRNIN